MPNTLIQTNTCLSNTAFLGVGIGLRHLHMAEILQQQPLVPWFEIISDNFISRSRQPHGGQDRSMLLAICERYPISMHGVGMSLGSVDPLDWDYIRSLKVLAKELNCQWISEHAAFVSVNQEHYHDLLPLPYTEEAVEHLSERICQVQDFLGVPLLIENATNYIHCNYNTLTDGEFLTELVNRSGCHLLIDINNLYVNQHNHGWSACEFINTVAPSSVKEIHLAGFSQEGEQLIDSHSATISEPVWQLYEQALARFKQTPTLIEWDNNIPEFKILQQQAARAESYLTRSPCAVPVAI